MKWNILFFANNFNISCSNLFKIGQFTLNSISIWYPIHWEQVLGQWIHLPAWPCSTQYSKIYKREKWITVLDWPANCLHANPIENSWENPQEKIKKNPISYTIEVNHYWSVGSGITGNLSGFNWFITRMNERNSKCKMLQQNIMYANIVLQKCVH